VAEAFLLDEDTGLACIVLNSIGRCAVSSTRGNKRNQDTRKQGEGRHTDTVLFRGGGDQPICG